MKEMEKVYNPKEIESKWYKFWEKNGLFNAEINPDKKPYTIVIPPPNVTGILHMGHVLNNTLQDIMIRYKKLRGYETLWLPGTDHAGIATQNMVERELSKQGKTRDDIGRENLVELIWKWKNEKGGRIIEQLKKLGASCDWRRERFTMDEGLTNAVQEVFIRLFQKGLIYKGKYIINWCPRCETALSDDEVEYEDLDSHLWYIKYPIKGKSNEFVVVATTRPETMLGDTAVAVNPKDKRYKHLIGEKVIIPLVEREVPIIADDFVDKEFGTGCVKVTPAHDPNDFEMGLRHNLPQILIMNGHAVMNKNAGIDYDGMNRFECREKVIEDLKERKLLEKIEKYSHSIGHCYRCHTVIEPYLSTQWFVKMKPLAKKAIEVVKKGKIKFQPPRWEKVYYNWMENIRDWCISRQIWWGHRIPAYYCDYCGEMIVAKEPPEKCPKCNKTKFTQDSDVLDTWFSSWLWPFSTMGWPKITKELEYFYPTDLLVTDPGIIFFWVARMIIASMEFMGKIPFRDVFLHGIVLDKQSRRMSKSLGNSPDPIDVIDNFGADALRFSMIFNTPKGSDVVYNDSLVETGRNFANKIWNATRFAITNAENIPGMPAPEDIKVEMADRWILHQLHTVIYEVSNAYDEYRFNDAAHLLYNFFWNEYCAWYLEIIKDRFYHSDDIASKRTAKYLMLRVLDYSVRMLHPIMPFITEEIWQRIQKFYNETEHNSIMQVYFPVADQDKLFPEDAEKMELIIKIITSIRAIRKDMNIPPGEKVKIAIKAIKGIDRLVLQENRHYIKVMAKVSDIYISDDVVKPPKSATTVVDNIEIYMPLTGIIDLEKERERLLKKLSKVERSLNHCIKKLDNKEFINNAPEEIVKRENERKEILEITSEKLKANIAFLE
ncbi:MAG: valine--tRNA ligase [Candidatus Cloacimonetes bacterium]|nr:valine--tRNA ligase [Candidatus Cloacimonadota bacterium]MBL7086481.1 valine--tRNA ligase [Candidatus Cloacimonadota bacterium]